MEFLLKALFGLGLTGIVMNFVLVATVLKIKKRHLEINLALVLAALDIAVASTTVVSSYIRLTWSSPRFPNLCRILSFVDFALVFVGMALVALISLVRWSRVASNKIPCLFWITTGAIALVYFPVAILSSLRGEFEVAPSGLDCPNQIDGTLLSTTVAWLLGISMVVLLFVTLWGYLSILLQLSEITQATKPPIIELPRVGLNKAVLARIFGIVIVYLTLIVPPAIILFVTATRIFRLTATIKLIYAIFTSTFSIANPCLVLFAHSTIYNQLIKCFRPSA